MAISTSLLAGQRRLAEHIIVAVNSILSLAQVKMSAPSPGKVKLEDEGHDFRRKIHIQAPTSLTEITRLCSNATAPFYPHEAEKKGCVPSEYGLVFGIFELTVFLVSPIIGANLNRLGMKATLNIGIGTVGVTSILFGLLDRIEDGKVFLGLSFALRIIEACGNSGFLTGSFSMIAKEFPDNVATMFAILETFFGIGMICGPTVGGALYELGGFTLPFVTLGGVLICATIFTSVILPNPTQTVEDSLNKPSMIQALKVPSIIMASYSVSCAAASLGFLQATLEPHMRDFGLSPLLVGCLFVISGGCYGEEWQSFPTEMSLIPINRRVFCPTGISAPMWGFFCDRKPPKVAAFVGAVLIAAGFVLMGPLPFFPFQKSIPLIIGALVLHGIGLGAQVVSGFADAHKQALAAGFPDTIDTYGLISGLWTSVFALGAFVGPTVAGILFDAIQFPMATLFIIVAQIFVIIFLSCFIGFDYFKSRAEARSTDDEDTTSLLDPEVPGYGAVETAEQRRDRASRSRNTRTRKYSEVVTGSVAGSMARSVSMAYPQFMMPGVANSYRNPPPSMAAFSHGIGGSAVDRIGADSDSLLQLPELREISD
eukprot:maker-scaffold79_size400133-snap-gene-1.9 protein:Tk03951 transcript:maker-scaffold79_size400133-snap-gene-1.9-mRNA-1 annotation:"uncharacterized mfs-type transporter"